MLHSISPVDGRYAKNTQELSNYFSEFALIYYRVVVECDYLCLLLTENIIKYEEEAKLLNALENIKQNFNDENGLQIKNIEATTNHDVKAVEYFIREKLKQDGFDKILPFVHFGLTSQDINNTAFPLMIKLAQENIMVPALKSVTEQLHHLSKLYANVPMLARTHGQAASPTTLGKEILVFYNRLSKQLFQLERISHSAKFGGATGNFNAHILAYPHINWSDFADKFVNDILGLQRTSVTTQIEPYDDFAALCHCWARINTILIDFARDIWTYISFDYFKQEVKAGEVGSSAMPHKVNPIDFENAEGNLGVANALLYHFAEKLPISRMQRDLTDSTVLRNVGVPFAHILIALKSLLKGLNKLKLNEAKIELDLVNNWAVVSEGIQTILRREGIEDAYEQLKDLTRGATGINKESIEAFIEILPVNDAIKAELKQLTPMNYTGNASAQVSKMTKR